MHLVKKVVAAAIMFVGAAFLFRLVFAEALVRYEMWSTGALTRAELSEDYGIGMMGLLVVDPAAIVAALIVAATTWILLARHNKPFQADARKRAARR